MRPEVNTPMSRERCATAGGARRVEGETVGLRFSHLDGPTLLGDDSESGARPRIVGRAGEERERVSAPLRADVPQLLALEEVLCDREIEVGGDQPCHGRLTLRAWA